MRHAILPVFILFAALACSGARADELRYTIRSAEGEIGSQVVRSDAPGQFHCEFHYRDNGRGPDISEDWSGGADGVADAYRSQGSSTFGGAIADRFSRKGAHAEWTSLAEAGASELAGAAYFPVEGSYAYLGSIASAALRHGGSLALLPSGSLHMRHLRDRELGSGARQRSVALYAIDGLDIEPYYAWFDRDGDRRLFAVLFPGFLRMVESGYESEIDGLLAAQVESVAAELHQLARRLTHRYPGPILIRNARVFDAEQARLGPPQDVYVERGRIAALAPAGSDARAPGTVFDAAGMSLLPGLFDMHGHESPWNAVQQLASGVTTLRDMGNNNANLARLRDAIDRGDALGARIIPAGFIEGKSPYSSTGGILVSDPDEVRAAIDWYAQRGYPQIKIYNSFHPEWVRAATQHAHQLGLRVSGHIPAFMRAEEAIRDGYDEVQHVNQLLLNFYVKPDTDTRTLARFTLIKENAHALDLDSAPVQDFLHLMVEHHTVIDPTLAAFESDFTQLQGEINPVFAAEAGRYPPVYERGNRTSSGDLVAETAVRNRASFARMVEFIGRCHRAGIPIVAGTDGPAGWMLHHELALYVKAGIAPAEVLRIATWNGATYARALADSGSITRGKRADLILVDGDPTQDITAIRRIRLTMKEGLVFYPAEIQQATGIQPLVPPLLPLP